MHVRRGDSDSGAHVVPHDWQHAAGIFNKEKENCSRMNCLDGDDDRDEDMKVYGLFPNKSKIALCGS